MLLIINSTKICNNCKYFIKGPKYNPIEYGKCSYFGEESNTGTFYEYASHCRLNNNMCGSDGLLFEEKDDKRNQSIIQFDIMSMYNKMFDIENKLYELKTKVFGEVTEKKELEEIDLVESRLLHELDETSRQITLFYMIK